MKKVKHLPTKVTHKMDRDGKKTACGEDIRKKPSCWEEVADYEKVTCRENGCR